MSLQLLYVTAPSAEVADELARGVVLAGHAACANVLAGMRSTYIWQGELTTDEECVLLVKTTQSAAAAAAAWLESHHPYDTPCVLQLPVDTANAAFSAWVRGQVADRGPG